MKYPFTIELPPRAIRALSHLQSETETLATCGIRVEVTKISDTTADVSLTATNGAMLGTFHAPACAIGGPVPEERGGFTFDFRSAIKLLEKKAPAWIVEVTLPEKPLEENNEQPPPARIRVWDMRGNPVLSGNANPKEYPDWRALLPRTSPHAVPGTCSLELLGQFMKAQRALGTAAAGGATIVSYPKPLETGEEGPMTAKIYAIHFSDPNFVGLLAPMHSNENPQPHLPRWIS